MSLEKVFRELTTNDEFKNFIPSQKDTEFEALSESIDKNGCIDPIIVWKGKGIIVDGHHRYEICKPLRIPFAIIEIEFEDEDAVKLWMLQHQLARRNLNNFQRSELVLKFKNALAAKAKENQRAGGGAVPTKSAKPLDTRDDMAIMAGVSPDTISKTERIIKEADEKEIQRLRDGETKINTVFSKLSNREKNKNTDESAALEKRFQSLLKGIDTRIGQISDMETELPFSCREQINTFIMKLMALVDSKNIISAA
jgi:ParB-like chromosome segregation protein Spo0J